MTRDDFWHCIEAAGDGHDPDEQVEAIQADLAKRSPEEIVDFKRHLTDVLGDAYSWALWGAAYLINGGCSDDAFHYFRGWLIVQGQSAYEQTLADPDSLADLPNLGDGDLEFEDILDVAGKAYEAVTGTEMPLDMPDDTDKDFDLGAKWDFEDDAEMQKRYPKLFAKFCD